MPEGSSDSEALAALIAFASVPPSVATLGPCSSDEASDTLSLSVGEGPAVVGGCGVSGCESSLLGLLGECDGTGTSGGPSDALGLLGECEGSGTSGGPSAALGRLAECEGTGTSGGPSDALVLLGECEGTGTSGCPSDALGLLGECEGTGTSGCPSDALDLLGECEGTGTSGCPSDALGLLGECEGTGTSGCPGLLGECEGTGTSGGPSDALVLLGEGKAGTPRGSSHGTRTSGPSDALEVLGELGTGSSLVSSPTAALPVASSRTAAVLISPVLGTLEGAGTALGLLGDGAASAVCEGTGELDSLLSDPLGEAGAATFDGSAVGFGLDAAGFGATSGASESEKNHAYRIS